MMNQATKSVAILLVSLVSAIPVFAYAFSTPSPVAHSSEVVREGTVTVGEITVTKDEGVIVEVPVTKVVAPAPFKAKRYPSVIDNGNQPPCGSTFGTRKQACKLPRS